VAVVQALLAAYPEAAEATTKVRRPSPLAAWMRGPERSSEVMICNQGQSGVIIRNRRAISGTQRAIRGLSVALSGPQRAPQRPSEVLSGSLEVIRGTQRPSEVIRDHSEPLRGTQWHSAALRGAQRALGTRSSPPLALRSASKHPVPHICSTHLIAHPPPLIAAVFHAQWGLPLHVAAYGSSSVAVVQVLLAAYPEAAKATNHVRRPSPLAAWMRGPERSSEVIICNQGQSGVIMSNWRAISSFQSHAEATQRSSEVIRGTQRHSEALRGTQTQSDALRGNHRHSAALRGTQRPLRGHPGPETDTMTQIASAIIGGATAARAPVCCAIVVRTSPSLSSLTTLASPPSFSACPRRRMATRRPTGPPSPMATPRSRPSSRAARCAGFACNQRVLRGHSEGTRRPSGALSGHPRALRGQ
jgi:hypothetical protein